MRLEILDNITDESKDEIFKIKLKHAKNTYLRLVYPFNHTITELPNDIAKDWQTRCAIELYKIGDDIGIKSYSENGLSETREKAGLPQDLLDELPPPKAGAII